MKVSSLVLCLSALILSQASFASEPSELRYHCTVEQGLLQTPPTGVLGEFDLTFAENSDFEITLPTFQMKRGAESNLHVWVQAFRFDVNYLRMAFVRIIPSEVEGDQPQLEFLSYTGIDFALNADIPSLGLQLSSGPSTRDALEILTLICTRL